MKAIVTVVGKDRVGIIAAVCVKSSDTAQNCGGIRKGGRRYVAGSGNGKT